MKTAREAFEALLNNEEFAENIPGAEEYFTKGFQAGHDAGAMRQVEWGKADRNTTMVHLHETQKELNKFKAMGKEMFKILKMYKEQSWSEIDPRFKRINLAYAMLKNGQYKELINELTN